MLGTLMAVCGTVLCLSGGVSGVNASMAIDAVEGITVEDFKPVDKGEKYGVCLNGVEYEYYINNGVVTLLPLE